MNAKIRLLTVATMIAAALMPVVALAHPGHGIGENFVAGVMHPLNGLDHVLMIVAVGAWAGALSRAGRLIVAASLALFVAVGAMQPVAPASGPALEAAIALTVIGSATLLAFGRSAPLWLVSALAASFALIHGFAHGAEGPAGSLAYAPGLAAATGGLALAASFLAARLQPHRGWLRWAGVLGAAFGTSAFVIA